MVHKICVTKYGKPVSVYYMDQFEEAIEVERHLRKKYASMEHLNIFSDYKITSEVMDTKPRDIVYYGYKVIVTIHDENMDAVHCHIHDVFPWETSQIPDAHIIGKIDRERMTMYEIFVVAKSVEHIVDQVKAILNG